MRMVSFPKGYDTDVLFGKIDLSPFIYPMMTMITSLVGGCISNSHGCFDIFDRM